MSEIGTNKNVGIKNPIIWLRAHLWLASSNYQAIPNQLQVFGSPVFYEYDPRYPTPPPPGSPLAEIMQAQMMNRDRGARTLIDEPDFKPRKTREGQRNFIGNLFKIPLDILCSLTKICLNKPPGGGVGPMPGGLMPGGPMPGGPMPGGLMPGGPMPGGPMPGGLMPGRLPLPPNIPRADH